MAEDRIVSRARSVSTKLDARFGLTATYRAPSESAPDIQTGATTTTNVDTSVVVRSLPYSVRELTELSAAGVTTTLVRWRMQTSYVSNVQDGDLLLVGGMRYEIQKAEKDQLGIEWTLFTRRPR